MGLPSRMSSGDQSLPPPKWIGHSLAGLLKGNVKGLRQIPIFRCTESLTKNTNKETRMASHHWPSSSFVIRSMHAMPWFVNCFKVKLLNKSDTGHKLFNAFFLGMWWKSYFLVSVTLTLQLVKLLLIKCNAAPRKTMQFFLFLINRRRFPVPFSLSFSDNLRLDNTLSRVG